jgi:hypothetical protein
MDLGVFACVDGTARLTAEGLPLLFCGTIDIAQKFHMVGSALVDSENGPQVVNFLTVLLKFTNIALRVLNDGDFDLTALGIEGVESVEIKYGMSDNCDATQGSFEKLGAQPCNCKCHIIRNVKNQKVVATMSPTESLTTAQN